MVCTLSVYVVILILSKPNLDDVTLSTLPPKPMPSTRPPQPTADARTIIYSCRHYRTIIETLLHELAHMVHSEHEAPFHALNRYKLHHQTAPSNGTIKLH